MIKSVSIILFFLIIAGCGKKSVVYPSPSYQYFVNSFITHAGEYKLFTRMGEIISPALVQHYKSEFAPFFYDVTGIFPDREFKRFAFVNNDSIINLSIIPVAEMKRTIIDEYDKFSNRGSVPVNDTNALNLHLEKYKIYRLVTTPSGYAYLDVESPVYFLKKVNDTLFFPVVKYIVFSRGPDIVSFNEGKFNNVFSPSGIEKLGSKDTLLVQTFDAAMIKEPQ